MWKMQEERKQKGVNSWKEGEEFYTSEEYACNIYFFIFSYFSQST
jgi:hypothetical protein